MNTRVKFFVGAVTTVALAASLEVAAHAVPARSTGTSLVLLGILAVSAEFLAFLVSNSMIGSIAFIPYLAAVIIEPSPAALLMIVGVKALAELRTTSPIKAVFNIAQHSLASALAILTYTGVGGVPLGQLGTAPLIGATQQAGVAALLAVLVSFVVNSILVSTAIALDGGAPIKSVWRANFLVTVTMDLLATPVVFVFAWLFVAHGALAAALVWVPILGLRQVHTSKIALERTNRELLELMVKSIEARDPYTSGHSRRVQQYSRIIARAVGLSEREIERVAQAALLHDIGKIHEKYAPILRNPGRLTPEEWAIIKEHPADGADLVGTISGLRGLTNAILHHHENWDGTGYPVGLAGELIPIESRVIMFADTIDAMTSRRPYREPLGPADVRRELTRCRGRQFDPQLTDRLLSSPHFERLFSARSGEFPAPNSAADRPTSGSGRIAQLVG